MKKILIIEDDKEIAELERDYLKANDILCDIADNGTVGFTMATQQEYALILLDLMLPGMDGFEVLRNIRKTKNTPIMIVSARREDQDKINGLGLGANDFLVKPFQPNEMVARVKAHIAYYERLTGEIHTQSNIICIATLKINTDSHEVFVQDTPVVLPNKEYELLLYLAKHPNIVFSKEQLFETIWGLDAIGEISTVTVHINRIREKIEEDSTTPKIIETVWGSGYRLRK